MKQRQKIVPLARSRVLESDRFDTVGELLRQDGFEITELDAMYIPGWRPASFNYWGRAVAR